MRGVRLFFVSVTIFLIYILSLFLVYRWAGDKYKEIGVNSGIIAGEHLVLSRARSGFGRLPLCPKDRHDGVIVIDSKAEKVVLFRSGEDILVCEKP